MKKDTPNKKSHAGLVIGGLAAAAAIGGYFLYHNKDARKKFKNVKGWMVKAKGEVLERIEKIKDINEAAYHKVIDAVMSRYKKMSSVTPKELAEITHELKAHWKVIQKEMSAGGKKVSATVKKIVTSAKSGKGTKSTSKPTTKSVSKPAPAQK